MPSILGANTLASGYDVANSLRFDDGSSAFLSKTFSGDGTSHDVGTVSVWLKRSELSDEQGIFTAGSSNRHFIRFETGGNLTFRAVTDSFHVQTNQLFRDSTAWYHIVIAYDTSDGTASNRVKMYVNGSQVTSFAQTDYPDQNLDIKLGAAELNCIGKDAEQTNPYYDGYMAEFAYIDGQQLAASSFGEFDEDSPTIWKPKDISAIDVNPGAAQASNGNGFYLDFKDSSNLGNDVGVNAGTDFAENNIVAADQTTDTCTNNFSTLNPLATSSLNDLSQANVKITGNSASNDGETFSTFIMPNATAKWYWEIKCTNKQSTGNPKLGFSQASKGFRLLNGGGGYGGAADGDLDIMVRPDGKTLENGSTSGSAVISTWDTDDVLSFALDSVNGAFYVGINGTWQSQRSNRATNCPQQISQKGL